MDALILIVGIAIGVPTGWFVTWIIFRSRVTQWRSELNQQRALDAEKTKLTDDNETRVRETFESLAAGALQKNNQAFLDLAASRFEGLRTQSSEDLEARRKPVENLVKPVSESIKKIDEKVTGLERARVEAYSKLTTQVTSLAQAQVRLQTETGRLGTALRAPTVRGRWGEMQLRRVVEIADMLPYCDFDTQPTVIGDAGPVRPDMNVKLPGGRLVVVDAKTPLQAYLEATETDDDELRQAKLDAHAQQVRTHITQLSSRAYWNQFSGSPEFVVMFLPNEAIFVSALEHDASLIERSIEQRVLIATPTTLIALLKAVSYDWQQEQVAKNAEEIRVLGQELHTRLNVLVGHFHRMRSGLNTAISAFNTAVGSLEGRVLVSARRFRELGAASGVEIEEPLQIDQSPRAISTGTEDDADLEMKSTHGSPNP